MNEILQWACIAALAVCIIYLETPRAGASPPPWPPSHDGPRHRQ